MGKYMNLTGHRACIDRQRPVMLSRDDRKSEKTSIELRNDFPSVLRRPLIAVCWRLSYA